MLRELLTGRSDRTLVQLARYTVVGGAAYVVDFGSLWALTDLAGVHYLVSAAIAFCLGLAVNYTLSVAWVFSARTLGSRWAELGVFAFIGVVGIGFNELCMALLTGLLGVHYLLSKIVSTFFVFAWNFTARKLVLFRRKR